MNITKSIVLALVMLTSSTAFAYSPDELTKECHKPKFTDFTLTEYKVPEQHEVAPESEFSFKVPAWTSTDSIKLSVKDKAIAFTIESNNSFHKIKAKLPAEYTGKVVRLNARAKASEGTCHEETGWLIKIADKAAE